MGVGEQGDYTKGRTVVHTKYGIGIVTQPGPILEAWTDEDVV